MNFKNFFKKKHPENTPNTNIFINKSKQEITEIKKICWINEDKAKIYNDIVRRDNNLFSKVLLPLYKQYIKSTDRILDMGAGTGRLSLAFAEMGCEVVACDISPAMLQYIYIYQKDYPKLSTFLGDGENPNFDELGKFDVITSLWFIPHFPYWSTFVLQQLKLCKVGGYIIFDMANTDNLKLCPKFQPDQTMQHMGYDWYMHLSKNDLKEFAENSGAVVEAMIPYNFLTRNAIFFNSLSPEEYKIFCKCIDKLYETPIAADALIKFENEIVSKLPYDNTAMNLIVLKKVKEI